MTETLKPLSQLAYANHRKQAGLPGATHAAVAKAIKSGRLVQCLSKDGARTLIDPVIADREWSANTNGIMRTDEPGAEPAAAPAAPGAIELDGLGIMKTKREKGGSTLADAATLADARAMKEKYLALSAKLDYELESGQLILAEDARRAAFAAARKARDMLLTMADRLAPIVAGLTDQFACHKAITAEVRRVCDELSTNPLDKPLEEGADDAE